LKSYDLVKAVCEGGVLEVLIDGCFFALSLDIPF